LTIEHRTPFALGGPPTLENLCLLCSAHNLENARQVFGAQHVENKIEERRRMSPTTRSLDADQQVLATLCGLGFGRTEAWTAIEQVLGHAPGLAHEREALLRACLLLLVPKAS
jgi:hypothetical protein